jgi:hypothetical protein
LAASPAGASAKEAIVLDIEVLEGVRPRGGRKYLFSPGGAVGGRDAAISGAGAQSALLI